MTYLEYAKEILLKNNYKLTSPRLLVIEILESSDISQNAYEIAEKIKTIDVVSVYRILDLFKKLHLIHETSEGKFIACQKFDCTNVKHCHHQFVCSSCHKTEEIHINDRLFISKLTKMFPKILINSHDFRFEGLCAKCK
jgi:Fe2+ or Zn2+ uptake regulation protein